MKRKLTLILLGMQIASFTLLSCNKDDDNNPSDTPQTQNDCVAVDVSKLVDKRWFRVGTNGQKWRQYKSDGTWISFGGDTNPDYYNFGDWAENTDTEDGVRITPCYIEMAVNGNSGYLAYREKVVILSDSHIKIGTKTVNDGEIFNEYKVSP